MAATTRTTTSPTAQKWQGRWEQLTGRVKKMWGQVTNDDLKQAEGDYERILGVIRERTGETREAIEKALNDAAADHCDPCNP
jgi:uncharacterized protein YjbJ (UPF0337 family)